MMTETPVTNRMLCELHPERFCRATRTRGRYTWVCYGKPGHNGPHMAGNSDNDPVYARWFDTVDGGGCIMTDWARCEAVRALGIPIVKFYSPGAPTQVGVWQLVEVREGHCHPGKCYVFSNGAMVGPHRYHAPADWFWGNR